MEIAMASLLGILIVSGWVLQAYFRGRFASLLPAEPAADEPPQVSWLAVLVVALIVGQSLIGQFSPPKPQVEIDISDLQYNVILAFAVAVLLLGALFTTPGLSLHDYGFRWRAWYDQVAFGGLAFLASLLPVYALLLATLPLRSTETLHPFLKLLRKEPDAEIIAWIGLAVMVMAPLAEELTYRVVLQSSLTRWLPIRVALPLTAVIFSAMHGWPDMIPLLPLSLVLGWVYYRHRSFLAIVTTHALFNGWMLAWAVFAPETS